MIAVLLAAGVGRRLGSFTDHHPKCLLPMGGKDLLARSLDALAGNGIDETVIIIGYCADQIRRHTGKRCGSMAIRHIVNPDYREGSILSLWQARDALQSDDTLIMDADVLYPESLLARLVASAHASCALLDGRVEGSGEEMILCANNGRVWDIVRRADGQILRPPQGVGAYDQHGESVGFFKLQRQHGRVLSGILDETIRAEGRSAEYEATFPELFRRCEVGYERVDDLPWTEIDFPADVERARGDVLPAIEALSNPPASA